MTAAGMTREERSALLAEALETHPALVPYDALNALATEADALEDEVQRWEARFGETVPPSGEAPRGTADAGTLPGLARAVEALDPIWLSENRGDLEEAEDAMHTAALDYAERRADHPLPEDVLRVLRATADYLAAQSAEPVQTGYTRAQFAAAVDEAHDHLHARTRALMSDDRVSAATHAEAAHEALHKVGAGLPRVGCATPDPEAQRIMSDLIALREREILCGHTIADLILCGGKDGGEPEHMPPVTKCGACLALRAEARKANP